MTKSKLSGLMLTIILAGIMFACSDDTSFTIGEDLTDIKSSVIVVDTTTIIAYTIKADSLQTSGYSKALAGRYNDGAFGTVTASSYFQLALPSSLSIDENSRYDSISLILKPTGYCYGDSTKDYTLQVHKLAEDLDNDDITYRYNVSGVSYFSEIMGSKTTVFRPSSGKEFTVKLSDTFGALLLSKILNEDDEVETQEKFNQYFPGLAIMPDELSQSSILQFDASDTTSKMRLYYHVGREEKYLDFQITGTSLQFNRIGSDYSNSALKILTDKEDILPSVASGNETYCQAGTVLMTRLEFPNLKKIFETYSAYKILKAELIVKPVKKSYQLVSLPESLNLYYTNTINDVGSVVTDAEGNTITSGLVMDYLYNETAYYFDVTSYLTTMIAYDKDDSPAMLLSLPTGNWGYSLDRLVLGDYNHSSNAIRLKITYWKY